ncbi:endoplasmic reticulum metallopeptidase 1 [Ixodes scapularis]
MAGGTRDGSLRFRQKSTNGVHNSAWNGVVEDGTPLQNDQRQNRMRANRLGGAFYACTLALYLAAAIVVDRCENSLPDVVGSVPGVLNDGRTFVGSRARSRLAELVSLGPRSVGSYENEVAAVDYLLKQLEHIRDRARPAHRIELAVQRPNGSFFLGFIDGFTSTYRNIQNVIARIAPRESQPAADKRHSLLVNCHFDTAPGSPGASDDAINCAIMLEILQVLSQRPDALRHPVIFLFNGAEENILQGAHGFITQHPWAKEVAAFVNLEACGAGGKELLFQASNSHPWLVRSYVEGAVRPFASIIAEEVFQSGLIPSDTDFRIFRDFGGLPGLDFAFAKNGHVYHTKYDNLDYVPGGSIQHAGDNILGLLLKILEAPELELGGVQSMDGTHQDSRDGMVYFDFLGFFMVTYTYSVGNLLVKLVVLVSLVSMAWRIKSSSAGRHLYHRELALQVWGRVLALVVILSSWGLGMLASVLVAHLLTLLGSTMAWYATPYLVVGLYYSTTVATLISVHWGIATLRRRSKAGMGAKIIGDPTEHEDDWSVLERYLDATQLLWMVVSCWLMSTGVQSCYLNISWLAITGVAMSVLSRWVLNFGRRGQHGRLLAVVLGSHVLPLLMAVYFCINLHMAIMPIMGRVGTLDNPEVSVAVISGFLAIAITSFMAPLIQVSRNGRLPVIFLAALSALSILFAVSPLGFPFSAAPGSACPQRMLIFNVERTFHNQQMKQTHSDTGIWVVPLDFNGPRSVRAHMSKGRKVHHVDCSQHVYCGMPYYFPVISKLRESYYIEAAGPIFHAKRKFELISQKMVLPNVRRLNLRLSGPSHMALVMSPRDGVELRGWSFTAGVATKGVSWQGRPTYFVYFSQGKDEGPWDFWLELSLPPNHPTSEPVLDIAFHTHLMQQSEHRQPEFLRFLDELPDWIHGTAWSSSVDLFVF